MLKRMERISLRISSVLSKVEPEPDLHTGSGSDQKVPAPAPQHCVLPCICSFSDGLNQYCGTEVSGADFFFEGGVGSVRVI